MTLSLLRGLRGGDRRLIFLAAGSRTQQLLGVGLIIDFSGVAPKPGTSQVLSSKTKII